MLLQAVGLLLAQTCRYQLVHSITSLVRPWHPASCCSTDTDVGAWKFTGSSTTAMGHVQKVLQHDDLLKVGQ